VESDRDLDEELAELPGERHPFPLRNALTHVSAGDPR
jgi:hypothetical protein